MKLATKLHLSLSVRMGVAILFTPSGDGPMLPGITKKKKKTVYTDYGKGNIFPLL
jgi:hypothetical protein